MAEILQGESNSNSDFGIRISELSARAAIPIDEANWPRFGVILNARTGTSVGYSTSEGLRREGREEVLSFEF
jgi:hypothetical protein